MLVTMIAVVSLDGCLTRHDGDGASSWASKEDQAHYKDVLGRFDAQILGAGTYRAHRNVFQRNARNAIGAPTFIATRDPQAFAGEEIPGRLTFTSQSPADLVAALRDAGHQHFGVLGGGLVYSSYLAAGVVDRLLLTVEPVVFGQGQRLAGDTPIDAAFDLEHVKHLNVSTLCLTYIRRPNQP